MFNIYEDSDTTLTFTNESTIVDEIWEGAFIKGTLHEYKMSYLYDNYQSSCLSLTSWYNTITTSGDNEHPKEISLDIILSTNNLPRRVSHLNVWRRQAIKDSNGIFQENFILVGSMSLKTGWIVNQDTGLMSATLTDKGFQKESFIAYSNLPENLPNMSVKYTLSTSVDGYHIVGNCYHEDQDGMEYFLLRSELDSFDMFNWPTNWVKLPNIPTALTSFGGKIFAFDRHNIYRIDPHTFAGIEDTFEGIGCSGPESIISTEYGMCFADMNNIYLHDGTKPIPIGDSIRSAREASFGLDTFNMAENVKISFDQSRGCFTFLLSRGKNGLYTEGNEFEFDSTGIPYTGYYHTDGVDVPFTGAYRSPTSRKLRKTGVQYYENQ